MAFHPRFLSVVALLNLSVVTSILPAFAQSNPNDEQLNQSSPPELNTHFYSAQTYWTEERLRSAKPLEPPTISQEELQRQLLSTEQPQKREEHDLSIPEADLGVLGVPSDADVAQAPYKHSGKLFFTKNGADYSCTGQFVGDGTILLTAAHCVRDENSGAWFTNVVLLKGFNAGSYQQRVTALCLSTKQGWVTGGAGRHKWDYAFVKMQAASNSGYFGLKIGVPNPSWEAVGYPSNFAGGQRLQKVAGNKGITAGGVVQMVGNPMRSGNSGGVWHSNGVAIGNNSYHITGNTTDEWSPFYDTETVNLWRFAKNGCK